MKLTRYIEIVEQQLNVTGIHASARFKEDLGADSLDMVELITTLEGEAGVEFDDLFIDKLKVVHSLYSELLRLIHAGINKELHGVYL